MISVLDLCLDIDLKLNKQASVEHQSIPNENKIVFLNQAQIKLIKKKVNTNNNYQLGFDAFLKRYEDLQGLVVPYTIKWYCDQSYFRNHNNRFDHVHR